MGLARSVGGASSALFRFCTYVFLRWIPGRFGPYLIPVLYLVHLATTLVVNQSVPKPLSSPAEAALVPRDPKDRPSFADVAKQGKPEPDNAVHAEHPHVVPDSPSAGAGSISKRNKKKKNANRSLHGVLNHADVDSTDGSDAESALAKFERLPRHRPARKASLTDLVRSIAFGTPTPKSAFLNLSTIAVNTVLFLAAMDAIWTPVFGMDESSLAFVRVGAVSHNSVKLVARIPPESTMIPRADAVAANDPLAAFGATYNSTSTVASTASTGDGLLPEDDFSGAKVAYRPTKPLGKWIVGPEIHTSEANDWVATVKLDGLWASTEYE
ncbi:hypothetical protein JCM10212_000481, partial [Sporobolomyces blumeae]